MNYTKKNISVNNLKESTSNSNIINVTNSLRQSSAAKTRNIKLNNYSYLNKNIPPSSKENETKTSFLASRIVFLRFI